MDYVDFFKSELKSSDLNSKIQKIALFVIRLDGVVLYSNEVKPLDKSKESIGALAAGLWQAAELSNNYLETKSRDFRLSFDTSDGGVYLLPLNLNGDIHLFGAMIQDQLNLGQIKNLLRRLRDKVEDNCINKNESGEDEYLFNDITDEEVDNLFSFVGK
ncbi:MAG: hypothetical protein GY909_11905 [Oligoflexia bacterium]|nr:hypothetical protein [Oligoflexia bacterium]